LLLLDGAHKTNRDSIFAQRGTAVGGVRPSVLAKSMNYLKSKRSAAMATGIMAFQARRHQKDERMGLVT
jgi:hypothetical protein